MGYGVYCGEKNVWNPASGVGNYFLGSIQLLEKMLEIESGIVSPVADQIEIDADKLHKFLNELMNFIEQTNNTPMMVMIAGVTEILLGLNESLNNPLPKATPKNRVLIERSKYVFYPLADYINWERN